MSYYHLNDRWLWLGFGLFAALAAHGIRFAIKDIVRLTRIDPVQLRNGAEPTEQQHEAPEDSISFPLNLSPTLTGETYMDPAISLATLATLTSSPNASIANSAISLLVARCMREPRLGRALEADLSSGDARRYWRAKGALAFMRGWDESAGAAGSGRGFSGDGDESDLGESVDFDPRAVRVQAGMWGGDWAPPVEETWEEEEEEEEGQEGGVEDVVSL